MAQKLFWSFEDDDETLSIIEWLVGILPAGRYRGFDFTAQAADLNLVLRHTLTGEKKVLEDLSESDYTGILMTRQGTVITEDAPVTIPVSSNPGGQPRIDTIFVQHVYIESTGGAAAIYGVIEGTPAASPVAPALTTPLEQVKIGELYLPAACAALNNVSVKFTQEKIPFLGKHPDNFGYWDMRQTWQLLQSFLLFSLGPWADISSLTDSIITLPGSGNLFTIPGEPDIPTGIGGISTRPVGSVIALKIIGGKAVIQAREENNDPIKNIVSPFTVSNPDIELYPLIDGDIVILMSRLDTDAAPDELVWDMVNVLRGSNAQLDAPNRYNAVQIEAKGADAINNVDNPGAIDIAPDGNFYGLTAAGAGTDIFYCMKSHGIGAGVEIRFTNDCTLYNTAADLPDGTYKYLRLDNGGIYLKSGAVVRFRESETYWEVAQISAGSLRPFIKTTTIFA